MQVGSILVGSGGMTRYCSKTDVWGFRGWDCCVWGNIDWVWVRMALTSVC